MFAPSPATGWLADRFGAAAVAAAGAVLLILAGMGGLGHHHGHDMVALLIVLGLGWNCMVGGSALLAASVPWALRPAPRPSARPPWPGRRRRGAPAAGILVALGGFTTLCLAGSAVGAALLAATCHRLGNAHAINQPGPLETPADPAGVSLACWFGGAQRSGDVAGVAGASGVVQAPGDERCGYG